MLKTLKHTNTEKHQNRIKQKTDKTPLNIKNMKNKKNGSAVKKFKNLNKNLSCRSHWLKTQKVKLRYRKATQRKRKGRANL